MRFGKLRMYFYLQLICAAIFVASKAVWLFSASTVGTITVHGLYVSKRGVEYYPSITVRYEAGGKVFTKEFQRSEVPLTQATIGVRYLSFAPSVARLDDFLGLWAEALGWWLFFAGVSGVLLLTNNQVFSKGTQFQLHKKFPWISMDEYFPASAPQARTYRAKGKRKDVPRRLE